MEIKYFALLFLVLQNASLALLMVYVQSGVAPEDRFNSGTAVIMGEVLKMLTCVAITFKLNDFNTTVTAQVLKGMF